MLREVKEKKNPFLLTLVIALVLTLGMSAIQLDPAYAVSRPGQVKSLKVTVKNYNSLKLTWKKVSGAKGYQIYRATSKNGKYKKVKTIKSGKTVSWTNTKLTTGKKYYYKVRAYKGSRTGKYSLK